MTKDKIDFSKINDIEMEINGGYPEYYESFIIRCMIGDREATQKEVDEINDDSTFVHECAFEQEN